MEPKASSQFPESEAPAKAEALGAPEKVEPEKYDELFQIKEISIELATRCDYEVRVFFGAPDC